MPNGNQELEQRPITDSDEQTEQPAPALGAESSHQDQPETVQPGSVSRADASELLEDPAATTAPGAATTATQGSGAAPAPPSSPAPAPPGAATTATQESGSVPAPPSRPAPAPPGTATTASSGTSTPASAPSTDPYALLKKDVSTLSEADKAARPDLLKKKYVDDWKQKKDKEMRELTDGLTDNEKSKEETRKSVNVPRKSKAAGFFEGVDELMDKGSKAVDYLGMGASFGIDTASAVYERQHESATKAGKTEEEMSDIKSGQDRTDKAGNIVNIITGGAGLLSGTYGSIRSGRKAKQKRLKGDSRGAKLARYDTASNIFGAASGAAGMAGGIAGIKGKDDASNWLGTTSSILDIAGSVTDTFKGIYQRRAYKDLANRKETTASKAKMAHQHMSSKEAYQQMKSAYKANAPGSHDKAKRMEMLKARHAHKRSKDFIEAMEAAQENAKIKSQAGSRGILSGALKTGSGLIGLAGSLAGQFGGTAGKIAGAVLGGISSLMKIGTQEIGDRRAEEKEKAASKQANDTRGRKYLDDKVASFLRKSEPQADHVTEDEAKAIIAQRLGVADPTQYGEIYKKLAERRADRILNKEEGYEDVLAAMGLTKDADKATILEALGIS